MREAVDTIPSILNKCLFVSPEGRTDGRTDGRTESRKLCPSAFLRKGGGQLKNCLQNKNYIQDKNNNKKQKQKTTTKNMGHALFFFFFMLEMELKLNILQLFF